jgi:hypothetical protein
MARLVEALPDMSKEIVEPPLEIFVIPDVYGAQAELGEDIIQGLATSDALDESADATERFKHMLLFRWIVDESLKRSRLVDVRGSIKRLIYPL